MGFVLALFNTARRIGSFLTGKKHRPITHKTLHKEFCEYFEELRKQYGPKFEELTERAGKKIEVKKLDPDQISVCPYEAMFWSFKHSVCLSDEVMKERDFVRALAHFVPTAFTSVWFKDPKSKKMKCAIHDMKLLEPKCFRNIVKECFGDYLRMLLIPEKHLKTIGGYRYGKLCATRNAILEMLGIHFEKESFFDDLYEPLDALLIGKRDITKFWRMLKIAKGEEHVLALMRKLPDDIKLHHDLSMQLEKHKKIIPRLKAAYSDNAEALATLTKIEKSIDKILAEETNWEHEVGLIKKARKQIEGKLAHITKEEDIKEIEERFDRLAKEEKIVREDLLIGVKKLDKALEKLAERKGIKV